MIRHIVLFKFKETANGKTKEENLREAKERMLAMRGNFGNDVFLRSFRLRSFQL